MFYCALPLSCNLLTVNTRVIYCNLRSGLSTLELNEYCIVLYRNIALVSTSRCCQTDCLAQQKYMHA